MVKTKENTNKELKKITRKSDEELSKDFNFFGVETKGSVFKSNKAIIIYAIIGIVFVFICSILSATYIQSNNNISKNTKNMTNIVISNSTKKKVVTKNGKQFVVLSKKEVISV